MQYANFLMHSCNECKGAVLTDHPYAHLSLHPPRSWPATRHGVQHSFFNPLCKSHSNTLSAGQQHGSHRSSSRLWCCSSFTDSVFNTPLIPYTHSWPAAWQPLHVKQAAAKVQRQGRPQMHSSHSWTRSWLLVGPTLSSSVWKTSAR